MTDKTPKKARKRAKQPSTIQTEEAKLAALAEQFRRIESEGLKKDIEQGRVARQIRPILKEEGELCEFVTNVLCSSMQQFSRVIARARAADLVPFNSLLKMSRTAIDVLAAEKVPKGALEEAVKRSKDGDRITEEVASEIADRWLADAGIARRKRPKKVKQPSDEITLKATPEAFARELADRYPPEQIYSIADKAAERSLASTTNRRNSVFALDAFRRVKQTLPKTATVKFGVASRNVLVHAGYISTFDGSLLTRAPFAHDGSFMVDAAAFGKALEGNPEIEQENGHIRLLYPDESEARLFTPPIDGFSSDKSLVDRMPDGERHQLPGKLLLALASLRHLTSPHAADPMASGVWLVSGHALVVNPPIIACVRDVGLGLGPALKLPNNAIDRVVEKHFEPYELLVETDRLWFRWNDGGLLAVGRDKLVEKKAADLAKAFVFLEAWDKPDFEISDKWRAAFERAAVIGAKSVRIYPDRLSATINGVNGNEDKVACHLEIPIETPVPKDTEGGCVEVAVETIRPAIQRAEAINFRAYPNRLSFQCGDVAGLVALGGQSNASERENNEGEE